MNLKRVGGIVHPLLVFYRLVLRPEFSLFYEYLRRL